MGKIYMCNKSKSVLAFFLSFLIFFSHVTVFAKDDDGEILLHGSFEDEEAVLKYWSGGVVDSAAAYEGRRGLQVSNPYGVTGFNKTTHVLDYIPEFTLEAGKFYTFSAYVLNPMAEYSGEVKAIASLNRGHNLSIEISGIGDEWSFVSVSFTAAVTGDYSLTVLLNGGDEYIGFFVDSFSLVRSDNYPMYTAFEGPETVFVPEEGYADYRYSLVTYDRDGLPINVLISDLDIETVDIPDGVEFDEEIGVLRVYAEAPANASFSLICRASAGYPLKESTLYITTTKNLLKDPSFEGDGEYWYSDSEMGVVDDSLYLYAENDGDYGVFSAVTYTEQLLLFSDNMYVFRADVKSEEEFPASNVYIENLSFASSGYAEINITGIGGGDWSSVVSAFKVENTGLYDLTINLYAPTKRPVYIDNVYLSVEEPKATSISLHAPGNIQIPSSSVTLPCYGVLHDQLGEDMEGDIELSIFPEGQGVTLENGTVTVRNGAKAGDYYVTAEHEDLESYIAITVSEYAVGDGGFEEKEPYEWWAASDGSLFSIIDYAGSRWGYVLSPDTTCILVNNSYMELSAGEYYVFSAETALGDAFITAFIADAFTGEYIPVCLFDSEHSAVEPFIVEESVVGRLVLYIESDESIVIAFDNIDISPAELYAADVTITGGEYGDTLRGSYTYVNNMTSEADNDISTTRWYIGDFADGPYEPFGAPNQNYLTFSSDMAGRFIVFEVTPICAETGLVGESVRSQPIFISLPPEDDERHDEDLVTPPLEELRPVVVEAVNTHSFSDIHGHWAEGRIASLAAAGIVSGRGNGRFDPDGYVTRAEFVAMLMRAFSLVPLGYSYSFKDVSSSDWYAGYIEAAVRRDLVNGVGHNTFAPNELVTREQMASLIYRTYIAAGGERAPETELGYYDAHMISPWALEDVKSVTALSFFYGTDMNLFEPARHATRAEAVSVIYGLLRYFY